MRHCHNNWNQWMYPIRIKRAYTNLWCMDTWEWAATWHLHSSGTVESGRGSTIPYRAVTHRDEYWSFPHQWPRMKQKLIHSEEMSLQTDSQTRKLSVIQYLWVHWNHHQPNTGAFPLQHKYIIFHTLELPLMCVSSMSRMVSLSWWCSITKHRKVFSREVSEMLRRKRSR